MKLFLLASGLILASLAAPALAADDMNSVPGQTTVDWSGGYVGVDGGYGTVKGKDSFGGSASLNGFLGGVHVGYNMIVDQYLIGAEVDGVVMNAKSTSVLNITTSTKWIGSARVRAGVTADRVLFYATAGVSLGGLELFNPARGGVTNKNTHVGWVLGAGLEAFLTDNISARIEYQHHDFGKRTYNLGAANFQVNGDADLVKVGLSFHF